MNKRRHDMSEIHHPDKVTAHEFTHEIETSLKGFVNNMKSLSIDGEEMYIEEWFEIFARWTEIMSEGFDPFLPEKS